MLKIPYKIPDYPKIRDSKTPSPGEPPGSLMAEGMSFPIFCTLENDSKNTYDL
jgi:hypothetical protein